MMCWVGPESKNSNFHQLFNSGGARPGKRGGRFPNPSNQAVAGLYGPPDIVAAQYAPKIKLPGRFSKQNRAAMIAAARLISIANSTNLLPPVRGTGPAPPSENHLQKCVRLLLVW